MDSKPLSVQVVGDVDHAPVLPHADDVNISGSTFTSKSDNQSVILFEPPIKSGIVKFEILVVYKLIGLGIAQDPAQFKRNEGPQVIGKDRVIFFNCDGSVAFAGREIHGNTKFDKGSYVALELNMDTKPRTLTLFIDGEEQKNYITDITDTVSFWVFLFKTKSSFKVTKFERLYKATALHGSGTIATTFQPDPSTTLVPIIPQTGKIDIDGDTFTQRNNNFPIISFDPVIKNGIIRFEILNVKRLLGIGISEESVRFGRGEYPSAKGWDKIVKYYHEGYIQHIGDEIKGNKTFGEGDRIAMEFNMESNPRTLSFFVNDIEQPNYATNIPAAVRFWAFLYLLSDSFKVLRFERLSAPIAVHGTGSHQWEFGTKWEQNK